LQNTSCDVRFEIVAQWVSIFNNFDKFHKNSVSFFLFLPRHIANYFVPNISHRYTVSNNGKQATTTAIEFF
jgi:hypothetical protein